METTDPANVEKPKLRLDTTSGFMREVRRIQYDRQEYEIEQQQKFQLIEEEKKKTEEKEKLEGLKADRWSHDKYEEIVFQEEKHKRNVTTKHTWNRRQQVIRSEKEPEMAQDIADDRKVESMEEKKIRAIKREQEKPSQQIYQPPSSRKEPTQYPKSPTRYEVPKESRESQAPFIGHRQKREKRFQNEASQDKSDHTSLSVNVQKKPGRAVQVREKSGQPMQLSENEEAFRLLCEKKTILEAEIHKREAVRIEREQDIFLERKRDFQLELSRQEEIQQLGSERLADRIAREEMLKKLNDPLFSSFQKPPSSPLGIDPYGTPNLNEYLNGSGYVDESQVILFVLDIETKEGIRALPVKMGDVPEDLSNLFCKQYPSASFDATLAHINQAFCVFRP